MIIIGKTGHPYGILGWMHIISFTEIKKNIFNYFPWILEKSRINLYKNDMIMYRKHINHFIIKLKNINNRNQVYNFTKQNILIQSNQLPILKNTEYYWHNILYCHIFNLKNEKIGLVSEILENKIYNTLKILAIKKNKYIYIPFIQPDIIKEIDINNKKIVINWTQYI
ncbi:Ribosome maturation factor RimM [Buchnera aphidicola (Cinara kochiana kochiana)]|uniref:Ribosome maturation factor RimM n=1 Tax=Buchnera aphidicola (Cinara kochiana kochiana) TaxID=2518976 RepID=A0A451D5X5_9GAMM|nr:ribosome maturation factor RimM [Buchnera aphidicola]VFP81165.1 Ribosome maturation factor RimM [Buchnera aphidicola (Cinara kochiana kochiana)]